MAQPISISGCGEPRVNDVVPSRLLYTSSCGTVYIILAKLWLAQVTSFLDYYFRPTTTVCGHCNCKVPCGRHEIQFTQNLSMLGRQTNFRITLFEKNHIWVGILHLFVVEAFTGAARLRQMNAVTFLVANRRYQQRERLPEGYRRQPSDPEPSQITTTGIHIYVALKGGQVTETSLPGVAMKNRVELLQPLVAVKI